MTPYSEIHVSKHKYLMKLSFSYHATKQSSECFCKNLTFNSIQLHKNLDNKYYLYTGYNYILVHSETLNRMTV